MAREDLARIPPDLVGSAPAVRLFLSEHFARETDANRLIAVVTETVGRFLGVARVGYGEIDASGEWMTVPVDWVDGVPSRAERRPFDRTSTFARLYAEGRTLNAPDVRLEPWYEEQRAYLEAEHARACLGVPVIDGGRLVAVFNALHTAPRAWREEEVVTLAHAGERLWSALQHLRTLARLRQGEEQFRTLAENVPALCWLADETGKPIWGNRAWYDFFEGSRATEGDHDHGVLHPEDREEATAAWARSLATGEPIERVVRLRGRDGPYRPFLSKTVPILGEDGRPRRWCGTIVDLTGRQEQAQREAFLVAWGDRVRALADPRAIMAETLDQLGRHFAVARANYAEATANGDALRVEQEWRDGAVTVVGESFPLAALGERVLADHLRGEPVCVCDVEDDARFDASNLQLYQAIGVRAFLSVPMVEDGRLCAVLSVQATSPREWTDAEAELLRELTDRTRAVVARARAEQQRRESEALLAAFMENAPLGMHLRDASGRYLMMNPELGRQIGIAPERVVGRTAAEFLPPAVAERVDALEAEALAGRAASTEFRFPEREDHAALLAVVFPIAVPGGGMKSGGFTIDVTERERAEAALARSRETSYQNEKLSALGSLLAGVSHELNNPLSIVVAQAVMMERQARGTELAERAQKIRKAADRCARIVQTFLAMARQKTPERRPVDLNGVAAAALELTGYGLRSDGIASERDFAADLPLISADSDQLHQIVVNLLVNAQQALAGETLAERRITLRTRRAAQANAVVLEIADTGPGIPEEVRRRVFEPFYTTKPQGQGTGVGLSFSQGLAEAHGGRLELVPSATGACFRLTLPIDEGQVLPAALPEQVAAELAPTRRALVVDDEQEIAESLGDFLSLEGYEAEIAVGGAAAIARLEAGDYDLIVSDLRMPGVDGPALHAWVAAERPHLLGRMAFTTGDTLGAAVARFLDEVGRPVLEKPFMPDGVRRFVEQVGDSSPRT